MSCPVCTMAVINQLFTYFSARWRQIINIAIADPVADATYNILGKMGPVLNKNVDASSPMYGINSCVNTFDNSSIITVVVIPSKNNQCLIFYYEDLTCQLSYRLRRMKTMGK